MLISKIMRDHPYSAKLWEIKHILQNYERTSIFCKIMRDQVYSAKLWEIKQAYSAKLWEIKHILQNYERSSIFCKIMRDQAYSAKKIKSAHCKYQDHTFRIMRIKVQSCEWMMYWITSSGSDPRKSFNCCSCSVCWDIGFFPILSSWNIFQF